MRPDRDQPHRFHPLVRDFLRSRLEDQVGLPEIRARHRAVGAALVGVDWGAAAWHFAQAGDSDEAGRVIDDAIPEIMASGQFDLAVPYLDGSAGATDRPGALVLRSRLEFARGNLERAKALAESAIRESRGGSLAGSSLLNLASLLGVAGSEQSAVEFARQAMTCELTPSQQLIAKATIALREAADEGDLQAIAEDLRILAAQQSHDGHRRHSGISNLNLAAALLWIGDAQGSLAAANRADGDLAGSAATSAERVAALAARARAFAHLGRVDEAERILKAGGSLPSALSRDEASIELASILSDFGSAESAASALARIDPDHLIPGFRAIWVMARGHVAIRTGETDLIAQMCKELSEEPCRDCAGKLRTELLRARSAIALGSREAVANIRELGRIADAQRSRVGRLWADLLLSIACPGPIHAEVLRVGPDEGYCLSMLADELSRNLHRMSDEARARVEAEARVVPERWREALRQATAEGGPSSSEGARLLSVVGLSDDADFLRSIASTCKAFRPYAASITRRLAPTVYVEDLGAVRIRLGDSQVVRVRRRKVLALACFLSSRQGMASTRDEALDALWPELGPDTAANSLHQTIFYLRRVFEPGYREGLSPGYVVFDGEVVSLSSDLVDSASRRCWKTLGNYSADSVEGATRLLRLYRGKYALDFAYEDWASSYRENLHAAVLARVEAAMEASASAGSTDAAIGLAHSLMAIDPAADGIELALVRIYKSSRRHAAAAEQYAHYASVVRDELGAEPPSFDEI